MTTAAIIPARGGSKGIPRKNLLPLFGKPLIAWSIEQALAAEGVDCVWVSSDDAEIQEVAAHYGARTIDRPAELATDTATSEDVLLHALFVMQAFGVDPDRIVFLQATSPIRQPGDIDGALALLSSEGVHCVYGARQIEGYVRGIASWAPRQRRQDRGQLPVEENGSLYAMLPVALREYGDRLGAASQPYLMHPLDSFQIDTPEDVELIKQLWPLRMAHTFGAGNAEGAWFRSKLTEAARA